jgi:hypothetical protein
MRNFLKKTLMKLPFTAGINQAEKLGSTQLVNELLDELNSTCNRFSIPDKVKQEIIEDGIRQDPDFYGLNSKILYKWFSRYVEQMKRKAPQSHADISEIVSENEIYYKKMLADLKEANPDYDVVKAAKEIYANLAATKSTREVPGSGTRIKRKILKQ